MSKVNKEALQRVRRHLASVPVRARNAQASAFVEEVIDRTPVLTGRARANYNVSLNQPDTTTDDNRFDPQGGVTADHLKEEVQRAKPGKLFITNALPYIQVIEFGNSSRAPVGMFDAAILSVKARTPEILASEFKKEVR